VNRYYDADSGQYLSPDPIGFAGGLRPQAYVFNPLDWVDPLGLAGCPERDERVRHIAEKHGGKKLDDGGYKMPNKRAAKNAASEIAGDLGSDASKVRRKDYTDISNTHKQNRSERVIGKISADKSSGYYDHSIGHHFDRRPHLNVWSKRFGATAKNNFHLYY
ncbi:RHS repeat-associated core domain-containing protein, partial [Vibrio vulnificus]